MQGYIININRAKNEDLIITILSKENLQTVYRFYGARHGVINLGFKIDYELENSLKSSIPRLRDVLHLGFQWLSDRNRLRAWQDFIALFYHHLKQTEELEPFYFLLVDEAAHKWNKQNPKRVAIETYTKILHHEGRLHSENTCFLCGEIIQEDTLSIIRGYLPTHKTCSNTYSINKKSIYELCTQSSTLFLNDKEIERLWYVLLEGF